MFLAKIPRHIRQNLIFEYCKTCICVVNFNAYAGFAYSSSNVTMFNVRLVSINTICFFISRSAFAESFVIIAFKIFREVQ